VPDRPTFYVDRCLGKAVVTALRAAGANVQAHDDHFAQGAQDEDWIPHVAARGWVILTKDKNIRRRPAEREALLTANARIFTLSSGNMRGADMAALLVARLSDMEQVANGLQAPFVAVVAPDGIHIVYPIPAPNSPPGEGEVRQPEA
jgi:predicted nuclease of predicted toxin-antitoxin system